MSTPLLSWGATSLPLLVDVVVEDNPTASVASIGLVGTCGTGGRIGVVLEGASLRLLSIPIVVSVNLFVNDCLLWLGHLGSQALSCNLSMATRGILLPDLDCCRQQNGIRMWNPVSQPDHRLLFAEDLR